MSRCLIAGVITVLCTVPASAGDMSAMHLAENDSIPLGAMQVASMGEVAVGDYWTYELKDEISGIIIQIRKVIVTDVSNGRIATRFDDTRTGRSGSIVYDRSWNIVRDGPNRYSPNSGTGVQLPLKLNAQWKSSVDEVNSNGNIWKISIDSKVAGQENVTTKAGTFATYRIETTQLVRDVKNPMEKAEISTRTWFSTDINHWVRRDFVRRENGLVIRNQTFELVEYGRKAAQ